MCSCVKGCCEVKENPKSEHEAKEKVIRQYPPITQKVVAVASTHMRGRSVQLRYTP